MSELRRVHTAAALERLLDSNETVLVEFGAAWCGPCRMFEPHLTKFAESRDDLTVVKIDVDDDDEFMVEYGIQSVPQVMLFENGEYQRHVQARTVVKLQQEV